MQLIARLSAAWRRLRARLHALGVLADAMQNYIRHQSGNQAGSVAF